MGEFTPPLKKIVRREGEIEYLECGHEQPRKKNNAQRRRCIQCRRKTVTVAERAEAQQGVRCPYCFDDFSEDTESRPCNKCKVRVHTACWEELTRCPTMGCAEAPVQVTIRPRQQDPIPSELFSNLDRTAQAWRDIYLILMCGSLVVAGIIFLGILAYCLRSC